MKLHAPSMGWFLGSLLIAISAAVSVLTPTPHITAYGAWIAIFAYIVFAVGNMA